MATMQGECIVWSSMEVPYIATYNQVRSSTLVLALCMPVLAIARQLSSCCLLTRTNKDHIPPCQACALLGELLVQMPVGGFSIHRGGCMMLS